MGKVTGFLEIDRQELKYQPASDRIRHFKEFTLPLTDPEVERQAARCMDCGIPFCQSDAGCPVDNQIPDWNDLVYRQDWQDAARNLHSTNNFPEFTGRICPAPCEEACTLNIENTPVAIKAVEQAIADKAWDAGWITPQPAGRSTGKSVAIVGAGSAGLAAAQQLARVGHEVHVYERYARPGGLLRYGIPDFKMEKGIIDRRAQQMEAEGVLFHYGANIDADGLRALVDKHDAVLLTTGAERPRDPGLPGVELEGVHYAMPFLVQQNRRVGREPFDDMPIVASGKHVVVIGGGDTASDCIGTSIRQGALQVTQLDIRPMPPVRENKDIVWPYWPTKFRTSSSQAEGADREFAAATLEIIGKNGRATHVRCARVDPSRRPIEGTEFDIRADLVLVAIGFSGPLLDTYLKAYDFSLDGRTNIAANTDDYRTNVDKVYAAGDVRRGQSLVVWAIREGRQAARAIDLDLMGETTLPR
ncbi:glutamate synthase subunit beta [Acuticoccus sp. M5D2P5]|uniref:glutamate synthase subunit beta n=1 Tax=Acuticoccus kalidii TaxID=2910977 RepID=UPI001F2CF192|nr:glutamate synthase subunit beta [Acuticoccus kalidii]MCF3935815.1 glutamate synthase subunit beta [Acuticoccus kalidii]